jgi:hypothetical protein
MPSTLANIAMAIPLILGGHELGHFKGAREAGLSVKMKDGVAFAPTNDPEKAAKFHGEGFKGQDLAVMLGQEFGLSPKEAKLFSGAKKLGHALLGSNSFKGIEMDRQAMGRVKGKEAQKVMQGALLASGISDMLKAFGKGLPDNQDLQFWTSDTGAPGLKYTRRF